MKAFLEEYGISIFVIVCVGVLIAMAEPLGVVIQNAIITAVNTFTSGTING